MKHFNPPIDQLASRGENITECGMSEEQLNRKSFWRTMFVYACKLAMKCLKLIVHKVGRKGGSVDETESKLKTDPQE